MDSSILKADIFFVVTTVFITIISIGIIIVVYYVILILRDVRYLIEKAKKEGEMILDDIEYMRQETKNRGLFVLNLLSSFVQRKTKSKSTKKKEEEL